MNNYIVKQSDIVDELYRNFSDTDRVPQTQRVEIEEANLKELLEDLMSVLSAKDVGEAEQIISDYGRAYLHMGFRGGFAVAKEILK